ncbi:MAG TPA: hypothetical protein VFA55_05840 [Candidatus Kapabacteria bacterium]|nr:hypothetical protein [Candidatus Kapabacteria bacterium]
MRKYFLWISVVFFLSVSAVAMADERLLREPVPVVRIYTSRRRRSTLRHYALPG